ncbi:heat shock 70 kDa protein [Trifolium repens]|nr:heat shock 70 kDa protein [Trifolium repens]
MAVADRVKLYSEVVVLQTVQQKVDRTEVMIYWKPPIEGWVKLNMDCAYKKGSSAGCGGVIRDSNGIWRGGFAKNLIIGSAYVAELWGVFKGLRYVRYLGFNRIEFNVDSIVVTQALYQFGYGRGRPLGGSLVICIRYLLELDWKVVINHTYRKANKCADMLANNIGCTMDSNMIYYDTCPGERHIVTLADVLVIATPQSTPV